MKLLNNKTVLIILALLVGLFLGKMFFSTENETKEDHSKHQVAEGQIWTCSMHPQIRQNEPGKCPICGMDLIPVDEVGDSPLNMEMSEEAVRLADIQTAKVQLTDPEKEIFMHGKVKVDERKISIITSRFEGRIEKLFIDFTGVSVVKGQKLASVYSPQLITAQQELFEALKYKDSNPVLYKAARNKLKLWNITEEQIIAIEKGGEPKQEVDIVSPVSGIVTTRMATLGDYVKEGTKLFEVVDLSHVWIVFDAYELDIPWVKKGDKITFKVSSIADKAFEGNVDFIDPLINPKTRTASVRVDFNNNSEQLKPEMFVEGRVSAKLPIKETKIIVPKSAVMWTGKRSIVYTKLKNANKPTFQFREITTGLDLGTHYIVEHGLEEGEEIVVNGTFKVDAAAQLAGKNSMMNQQTTGYMGQYHVSEGFKQQLTLFFNQYIALKNALVDSDFEKAKQKGISLQQKLKTFDMTELHDEAHELWMKKGENIEVAISNFLSAKNIDEQRISFEPLSENLSVVIESFGLHGVKAYKDYCPMAVNDEGAIWLSEVEEIRNPYFGEKMLKCGEVQKVINSEIKTEKSKPVTGHNH
ncbi:MAG: efflux RND transporter periplasmic adaptor subunit [Flavobacteriales bacterium]|nr:efflux RND transporter periplasmic adaptor subunit [Flavobacteriales bacterium]MCB9334722.1 efflux RND transporter periplasmic adaptor subunit [Flavobacteriales bacterium]